MTGAPQFGWLPQDRAGDETQTAYRVVVRNALTGAQVWDSGQVIDTQDDYQTAGENYYDAVDVTAQARAAQQAAGSARDQLAVGVLYAHWAVGEAHPEGPQPYPTTLAADAPAGSASITVAASTASTCQSAPDRSAEFCVETVVYQVSVP